MCGPPPNKTWKLRGPPPNRRISFSWLQSAFVTRDISHCHLRWSTKLGMSNWQHHPSKVLVCSPILRISFRVEYHAEALANHLAPWRKCFCIEQKTQSSQLKKDSKKSHRLLEEFFCRLTSCLPLLTSFYICLHLFTSALKKPYQTIGRCKQM